MGRTVIVGAGIGGLVSALMIGRRGGQVIVCERDASAVPERADEMWASWPRPGTAQARLGHTFLAGFRRQLEQRLPDVLEQVFAAGAQPWDDAARIPGSERRPKDAELVSIMARRPVVEGVLRRAAEAEPTVEIRRGCQAAGLVAEPASANGAPRVIGVAVRGQSSIAADTVIIAGGRTLPVGRWFREIGAAAPPERAEACGSACFTRYFRLRDRAGEDDAVTRQLTFHHEPGYVVGELVGADRRTFATELAPPISDKELHRLRDPVVWMAAARTVPAWREWLDPERSDPISPTVEIMGPERNVVRTFVEHGRPLAVGVHVIGDARCQTDSLFAWGCANAMLAAAALADVLADHPDDPDAQALAFEHQVGVELDERFLHSRARDRAWQAELAGEPTDPADAGTGLIDNLLYPAVKQDAEVCRAVTRWELQLDPADGLLANQDIVERARMAEAPAAAVSTFPSRDELLAAMDSATSSQ